MATAIRPVASILPTSSRCRRFEASFRVPDGQGLWDAFWMLSEQFHYGTWAASGEIDILEVYNYPLPYALFRRGVRFQRKSLGVSSGTATDPG